MKQSHTKDRNIDKMCIDYKKAFDSVWSPLLYMDDIKINATTNSELKKLADITQTFYKDIQMQFSVDTCKIHSIIREKSQHNTYLLNSG